MILLIVLSGLFLFVIETNCQNISTPYLSFRGQNLSNNSYVDISQVSAGENNCRDCVQCRSELTGCCNGPLFGNWFAPNGNRLPFPGPDVGISHNRGNQRVDILRANNANSPTGIYRCDVAFNVSNPSLMKTLYIGLYTSNGGDITVSDDVILTVDSDLNGESPQFTLTCTSTGGPATTVTWTRASTILTEGNVTVLDDPVTAHYTHTLTVTERLPGLYSCTVANNKPSTDSTSFTVQEASAPTDLNSTIGEDSTSVLLTWTPPTPLGYTTGYRISFTDGGGNGNVTDVSAGSTDNYTLTGLRRGEMYTISIVGLSEHFFSQRVSWDSIGFSQDQNEGEKGKVNGKEEEEEEEEESEEEKDKQIEVNQIEEDGNQTEEEKSQSIHDVLGPIVAGSSVFIFVVVSVICTTILLLLWRRNQQLKHKLQLSLHSISSPIHEHNI